jgi:drug/metabolite transporter (DMT)-like permease
LFVYRLDIKKEVRKIGNSDIRKFIFLIVCLGTMQLTTNYTFEHMDVGYSLSLFQLSTIVSVLLGYRFFRERDIRKKLIGSAIMIIGSVVIIILK